MTSEISQFHLERQYVVVFNMFPDFLVESRLFGTKVLKYVDIKLYDNKVLFLILVLDELSSTTASGIHTCGTEIELNERG